jgi:Type IV pilin-like G and H, putative
MKILNSFSSWASLCISFVMISTYYISACEDVGKSHRSKELSYISLMNKEQSYRRTGNIGKFSDNFKDLMVEIPRTEFPEETDNYVYSTNTNGDWAHNIALPKVDGLKSYIGLVYYYKDEANKPKTALVVCISEKPTKLIPADSIKHVIVDGYPLCPNGYLRKIL